MTERREVKLKRNPEHKLEYAAVVVWNIIASFYKPVFNGFVIVFFYFFLINKPWYTVLLSFSLQSLIMFQQQLVVLGVSD